jgi:subtilisin family serine protease
MTTRRPLAAQHWGLRMRLWVPSGLVLTVGLAGSMVLGVTSGVPSGAVPHWGAGALMTSPLPAASEDPGGPSAAIERTDAGRGADALYLSKLDPSLRIIVDHSSQDRLGNSRCLTLPSPRTPAPGQARVGPLNHISESYILCHVRFASDGWRLSTPGTLVRARAGDVGLVAVKAGALEPLASLSDVMAVSLSPPMSLKNDVATVETGAREARATYTVTGAGVLLGFIGSGADVSHPDFLDETGGSRVLYLLDLSDPGDTDGDGVLDGPDFFGGTLYSKAQIDSAVAGLRDIPGLDRRGHETHVMGVAAGNGRGTGNGFPTGTFAGVAPEADLIVIKSSLADLGFVGPGEASAGLAFVDSIAAQLAAPYVVNMSFGTQLSPHDGTSLEERFIDNVVGRGKPGKAVIVAAGNEGSNYGSSPSLHCSAALVRDERVSCAFTLPSYAPQPGELNDGLILDMWYDASDEMRVTVRSPGGSEYPVSTGSSHRWAGGEGSVYIENALSPSALNLDNECFIQLDDEDGIAPAPGTWSVAVEAISVRDSGRFDVWLAFCAGLGGQVGFDPGPLVTNERLVASPGNAFNAITVGSYTNKESWRDLDNNLIYFEPFGEPPAGAIAPGSSPGPTRDGRTKPELTAPGRAITSTLSADAWPGVSDVSIFNGCPANARRCLIAGDGLHAVARGTSFSAAHVAGAAALLLEASPGLDANELRDLLELTARPGDVTGGPWGYGKIDVLAAVSSADASRLVEYFTAVSDRGRVVLSWRASPTAGVEGFRLYRAYSVTGAYEMIYSSPGPEGSYVDSGLGQGATPFYRLGVLLAGGQERELPPISPSPQTVRPAIMLVSLSPSPTRLLSNLLVSSSVAGTAVVRAYDTAGRLVNERAIRIPDADSKIEYKWLWVDRDGEPVASGVYYISVELAGSRAVAKTVVLR